MCLLYVTSPGSVRLTLALRDGQVQVLAAGGADIEEVGSLACLDSNGVHVLLPTVIPSPVRLVAIAFHVSDLVSKR